MAEFGGDLFITADGAVLRSKDHGMTWARVRGPEGKVRGLSVQGGALYVREAEGHWYYRSTKGDGDWTQQPVPQDCLIATLYPDQPITSVPSTVQRVITAQVGLTFFFPFTFEYVYP